MTDRFLSSQLKLKHQQQPTWLELSARDERCEFVFDKKINVACWKFKKMVLMMLEVVGVVVMKVVLLWSSDGDDVDRMLKERIHSILYSFEILS